MPMSYIDHDYSLVGKRVNLATMDSVYLYNDLTLVYNILNYGVISSPLCNLFSFRSVGYFLRDHRALREEHVSDQSLFHSTVHRLRRLWNRLPESLLNLRDFIEFKNSVKRECFVY